MTVALQTTAQDRRKELILSTIHTIASDGISNVTLAKVASNSELSPAIINFYFKTKRQLLLDTLVFLEQEWTSILQSRLEHAVSAEQRILGYIHSCFDQRIFVADKIAAWYAYWSANHSDKDYRDILTKSDQFDIQLIKECVAELLDLSSSDKLDAEVLARGLQGMVDSLWRQALISSDSISRVDAIEMCERYLSQFMSFNDVPFEPELKSNEVSDLLPFWTYQDDEFFELEIERLFQPNWMLVGHVSEIPATGDYLTFQGFGERALVVRDKRGKVNAFHNICRHRGSTILTGEGRCRQSLSCPFHGWRYNFDGKLQFVPGRSGFSTLDPEKYSLKPVDLEIWQGFIFIRFVSGGLSVQEQMQPIEHEIEHYRLNELQPYQEPTQYAFQNPESLPINWKIYHDIDNEGYHVPIGHPTLQQLYGLSYVDSYVKDIPISKGRFNERVGNLWSVKHYRKLMPKFQHLPDDRQDLWLYIGIFPNLVLALYPEMVEIYMSIPCTPTRTEVIGKCYALPDERRGIKALRYLNRRINMITAGEDYFYMNAMQEGLKSSVFPKWTLSETAETGIRAYHRAIQARLPVAKLENKPRPGTIAKLNDQLAVNGNFQARH